MALVLADRVQQTGTANTTVSFTLSNFVAGYQSFAVVGNGNTTYYAATDGLGNWEVGIGTYSTTGPTLTRTTILSSSNSGSAVTFPGTVNVFVTYPSEKSVNLDGSGNVSALGTVSSGVWQGTAVAVGYGGTGVTTSTGTGSVVLSTSPTIITPVISSLSSASATALTLQSAGTTAVTIDTSQNVGIGTSSTSGYKVAFKNGAKNQFFNTDASSGFYYSDGNYYFGAINADNVVAITNNTERMRIDSNGNVGIGTSSTSGYKVAFKNGAKNQFFNTDAISGYYYSDGNYYFGAINADNVVAITNNTERMRIDSSGNLLVGTTSAAAYSNGIVIGPNIGTGAAVSLGHASGTSSGAGYLLFGYNGSSIGSISQNGTTGVLYNTTSDYRLKNNQAPLTGSGKFIDALQPKIWEWAQDGSKGAGFIAHEFAEVSPSSVNGEKDAVDAEGKPLYQSMQSSSAEVIANLVAEIQSLRKRLAALEAK